jgi:hypothetical protein
VVFLLVHQVSAGRAITWASCPIRCPTWWATSAARKTFTGFQQIGAYVGYVAIVMWTGREHLKHVTRRAFGRERARESEKNEALSYPVAFWGFVLSFCSSSAGAARRAWGRAWPFVLWMSYLVISIALTRLIVEGGLVFVQQGWTRWAQWHRLSTPGRERCCRPKASCRALPARSMMTDMRAFFCPLCAGL